MRAARQERILASSDQVAIDAVAAKLMGFDPMALKFIRLAHERGLGVGDPRDIEIVGRRDGRSGELELRRPVPEHDVRLAEPAPHLLGPLKKPIEWSLKTWLAPWAYVASVPTTTSSGTRSWPATDARVPARATGAGSSPTGSPSRRTRCGSRPWGTHRAFADRPGGVRAVAPDPRHHASRSARAAPPGGAGPTPSPPPTEPTADEQAGPELPLP